MNGVEGLLRPPGGVGARRRRTRPAPGTPRRRAGSRSSGESRRATGGACRDRPAHRDRQVRLGVAVADVVSPRCPGRPRASCSRCRVARSAQDLLERWCGPRCRQPYDARHRRFRRAPSEPTAATRAAPAPRPTPPRASFGSHRRPRLPRADPNRAPIRRRPDAARSYMPAELAAGDVEHLAVDVVRRAPSTRNRTGPAASSGCAGRPSGMIIDAIARICSGMPELDLLAGRSLDLLALLLGLGEPGLDEAEGDRVDVDLERAPLLGERLRQADDAGLRRRVVGLAGVAHRARDRGDVDDLAEDLLALAQLRLRGLAPVRRERPASPGRGRSCGCRASPGTARRSSCGRRRPRCSRRC